MTTTIKISDLPAANTPLAGTELVPIVQDNITKKVQSVYLGGGGGGSFTGKTEIQTATAYTATCDTTASGCVSKPDYRLSNHPLDKVAHLGSTMRYD